MYNAQLEVVHEELAAASQTLTTSASSAKAEKQIKLEVVGGPAGGATMTKAESAALEKRVSAQYWKMYAC